ncbi:MAG: hypothetical protein PHQ22_10805 [Sulfuricurvum sp.]|nr:hypothetical protein [Sulfuricurvum sp.]
MFLNNLLNCCGDTTQLTPTQIDGIVFALANRCSQAKKDKLTLALQDVRGISKIGQLSAIQLHSYGISIAEPYKGIHKDLLNHLLNQ